jgi:hypothetical protein
MKSPILIHDGISAQVTVDGLSKDLETEISKEIQEEIKRKIKLFELGLYGERSVQFELMNSFLPIHILHISNTTG